MIFLVKFNSHCNWCENRGSHRSDFRKTPMFQIFYSLILLKMTTKSHDKWVDMRGVKTVFSKKPSVCFKSRGA